MYPQVLINLRTDIKINPDNHEKIQKAVKDVEKILGANGRVLLRASGTEPLIRVMVEGVDEALVNKCANQLADEVKKAIDA